MTKKKTRKRKPKQGTNGHIDLLELNLPVKIRGGPNDGKTFLVNGLAVLGVADRLREKHRLQEIDGRVQPTVGFEDELTAQLIERGYGWMTQSTALALWVEASARWEELQKKTSESPS